MSEDNTEDAVVVKIFADKCLTDREGEILGLQVGMNIGLSPTLLAVFDNGLVMEYVRGRVLTYEDYGNSSIMRYIYISGFESILYQLFLNHSLFIWYMG